MSTLLIADDERTIREGIASSIDWASLGVSRVLLASNGRKAYAMIAAEKPDVAIVDIVMPEMTGIELITRCRREGDCPAFVIISGHDEFTYAREALRNRVHDYILKPCDANEIAEAVRSIIRELEQKRSAEAERRDMREQLDALAPGARERLFRDFISGTTVSPSRLQALLQPLDPGTVMLQLLILLAGGPDQDRAMRIMERSMAVRTGPLSRLPAATMEDALVMLLAPEDRGAVEDVVSGLRGELVGAGCGDCLAVVSAPGELDTLPGLYVAARQAARRAVMAGTAGEPGRVLCVSDNPCGPAVRTVMRYVDQHYRDVSLSLGAVAREVLRLNGDYVGKLFKRECGLAFNEYLMAVRMERARRIIAASDGVRMYEVASWVGFGEDAAYFSRVFRRWVGVPPGEYRRRGGA